MTHGKSQGQSSFSGNEVLGIINSSIQKEFDSNQRILSFEEYLVYFSRNTEKQIRGSAQYLVDMMDHFGTTSLNPQGESQSSTTNFSRRFKIFDFPVDGSNRKVEGQEWVQNQIYR